MKNSFKNIFLLIAYCSFINAYSALDVAKIKTKSKARTSQLKKLIRTNQVEPDLTAQIAQIIYYKIKELQILIEQGRTDEATALNNAVKELSNSLVQTNAQSIIAKLKKDIEANRNDILKEVKANISTITNLHDAKIKVTKTILNQTTDFYKALYDSVKNKKVSCPSSLKNYCSAQYTTLPAPSNLQFPEPKKIIKHIALLKKQGNR